jgi:hypothetical protein
MKNDARIVHDPRLAGMQTLSGAEASSVYGGARIHIPIGYDADGNVVWEWVDV